MANKKVTPKIYESYCMKCGRMLPIDEFYKSPNPNHTSKVLPYCRKCCNSILQDYLKRFGSMESAVYFTCADVGVPFIRKIYESYMEKVQTSANYNNYWGNYMTSMIMNQTKADKEKWKGFYATDVDFKDIKSLQVSEKKMEAEQEELRYLWGQDKDIKQLQYLETKWAELVLDKELDVYQEQLYRNLCQTMLDIYEGVDVDKALERQRKLAKDLGIDKFEVERRKTDVEQMLEYEIWKMENEEPAEFYKNKELYQDFRGIHKSWVKEILRPVVNLITGSKDYNIEKEDLPEIDERLSEHE